MDIDTHMHTHVHDMNAWHACTHTHTPVFAPSFSLKSVQTCESSLPGLLVRLSCGAGLELFTHAGFVIAGFSVVEFSVVTVVNGSVDACRCATKKDIMCKCMSILSACAWQLLHFLPTQKIHANNRMSYC